MNNIKKFTFIDFFAGIGGFRKGLEGIGGDCIFSSEIDKQCELTYRENFGEDFSHYDISTLDENKVPKSDIICAGFPCQPFSIAGNRSGFNDIRSNVFFDLMRIVKKTKPKVVFLENVPNLKTHDKGKSFNLILSELESAGYTHYNEVLDSKFFNIPQSRKRVYIIAFRNDLNITEFNFTKKNDKIVTIRDILIQNDNSIPISEKWENYIDLYTNKKKLAEIKFNVPKTRKILERKDIDADIKDCIFQIRSSGIRALSLDKPFPTFAVSVSGGGAMIPVLSKEKRHLSLREIARIMGYPDSYIFPVSRTNAIKQLSNSVCPPIIESIGKDIINTIQLKS